MIKYFCDRCGNEITGKVNEIINTTEAISCPTKEVVATFENKEHICDECQQKDLTCGFEIGDKVVTDDGRVGTIADICTCDRCKKRGFYEPKVVTNVGLDRIWITDTDKENRFISFYQIGDRIFGNIDKEASERIREEITSLKYNIFQYESQLDVIKKLEDNNDVI